jgi:hypothetical protein
MGRYEVRQGDKSTEMSYINLCVTSRDTGVESTENSSIDTVRRTISALHC